MKCIVLIDGSNLDATLKILGFAIDYKRLLDYFDNPLRMYYFTALPPSTEQSTLRPMVDWMEYNGCTVVQKVYSEWTDKDGVTKIKGNMDIEIAVTAMEMASYVTDVVLFSGDGDFRFLIEALQRRGVKVTIVSAIRISPAMCADSLRRQADQFIDLAEIRDQIERGETSPRRRYPINNGSLQ